MMKCVQGGEVWINISPPRREEQADMSVVAGGGDWRTRHCGLVFAIAIFTFQNLRGPARDHRSFGKLDSGISYFAVELVNNRYDLGLTRGPRRERRQVLRGIEALELPLHNGGVLSCHCGPILRS